MPRKGQAPQRLVEPDPLFGNRLVAKLINRVMRDGKKSVSQRLIYEAFEQIQQKTNDDPLKVFLAALENIKPTMEVRPRRVGGAAYQVPMPVRGTRREALAIRWLILAAQARPNSEYKTFADKIAVELLDAAEGKGGAVRKRQEIERIAEANRAFAHFRW